MKWTVFWSRGPGDDPQNGQFEVDATGIKHALRMAWLRLMDARIQYDGVIRSDLLQDIENDGCGPRGPEADQYLAEAVRRGDINLKLDDRPLRFDGDDIGKL